MHAQQPITLQIFYFLYYKYKYTRLETSRLISHECHTKSLGKSHKNTSDRYGNNGFLKLTKFPTRFICYGWELSVIVSHTDKLVQSWWPFALSEWELRMWFEIRGGWTAVTRTYRQACGIGKNLNIIRFFCFKMRTKFTVADESSRKFSVLYESVVSVTIWCIFMRFLERFRVTLVADQTWSLQPSIFICI